MSDIYIPELVELDSYWQKAVQDAIRETVKGEEKLHNALRNRKNLNEKLKLFGLKPILSRLHFTNMSALEIGSAEEQDSDTESEPSNVSMKAKPSPDFDSSRSMSGSGDSPCEEDNRKSLTKPLFGNGSLDKVKKSQNSFNCEPMGDEKMSEELSDPNVEDDDYPAFSKKPFRKERNKKNIQWLHVRNGSDFENSDSESTEEDDSTEKIPYQKNRFSRNKNFYLNDTIFKCKGKAGRTSNKYQRKKDLKLEVNPKSSKKDHQSLERRLHLALAKRDILNKKLKAPGVKSSTMIEVSLSTVKAAENRFGKKRLTSFIRFYLELYKELYLKMPVKRIAEEAAKRWRAMNSKERSKWANGTGHSVS